MLHSLACQSWLLDDCSPCIPEGHGLPPGSQAHPTWTVASKDRHESRGNKCAQLQCGKNPARHSQVPVSMSGSQA